MALLMSHKIAIVQFVALFLAYSAKFTALNDDDMVYCALPCRMIHTVCQFIPCSVLGTPQCGYTARELPLSLTDGILILNWHNRYRHRFASGNNTDFTIHAANMNVLTYDPELAFIAQCWANTCTVGHDMCRTSLDFPYVGQNMMFFDDVEQPDDPRLLMKAVHWWMEEGDEKELINMKEYNRDVSYGNFTQIIWAKTERVGCGRTFFKGNVLLICNYGPGGNIEGEEVFVEGPPCSQCRMGCSKKFTGLCDTKGHNDTFRPPFVIACASTLQGFASLFSLFIFHYIYC